METQIITGLALWFAAAFVVCFFNYACSVVSNGKRS